MIDTKWLTHARFEPAAPRLNRRRWQFAVGALLLMLLVLAGRGYLGELLATSQDLAEDRQEREWLAAEVERLRTELAIENATRTALEQQAAELTSRVAELDQQVEFLAVRRDSARKTE